MANVNKCMRAYGTLLDLHTIINQSERRIRKCKLQRYNSMDTLHSICAKTQLLTQ
jgi:hypothetical protein